MTDKERSFEERLSKIEQAISQLTKSVEKFSGVKKITLLK